MSTIIESGRGDGYKASVTKDGLLETASYTKFDIARESKEGHAFELSFGKMAFVAGGENNIVYMKNNSNLNFLIHNFRFCWNGGSTNFNRSYWVNIYKHMSVPTANATTGQSGYNSSSHNLHLANALLPTLDIRFWDGVGSGMTVADNGSHVSTICVPYGGKCVDYHGAMVLPPAAVIGITVDPEETGNGSIAVLGYFD